MGVSLKATNMQIRDQGLVISLFWLLLCNVVPIGIVPQALASGGKINKALIKAEKFDFITELRKSVADSLPLGSEPDISWRLRTMPQGAGDLAALGETSLKAGAYFSAAISFLAASQGQLGCGQYEKSKSLVDKAFDLMPKLTIVQQKYILQSIPGLIDPFARHRDSGVNSCTTLMLERALAALETLPPADRDEKTQARLTDALVNVYSGQHNTVAAAALLEKSLASGAKGVKNTSSYYATFSKLIGFYQEQKSVQDVIKTVKRFTSALLNSPEDDYAALPYFSEAMGAGANFLSNDEINLLREKQLERARKLLAQVPGDSELNKNAYDAGTRMLETGTRLLDNRYSYNFDNTAPANIFAWKQAQLGLLLALRCGRETRFIRYSDFARAAKLMCTPSELNSLIQLCGEFSLPANKLLGDSYGLSALKQALAADQTAQQRQSAYAEALKDQDIKLMTMLSAYDKGDREHVPELLKLIVSVASTNRHSLDSTQSKILVEKAVKIRLANPDKLSLPKDNNVYLLRYGDSVDSAILALLLDPFRSRDMLIDAGLIKQYVLFLENNSSRAIERYFSDLSRYLSASDYLELLQKIVQVRSQKNGARSKDLIVPLSAIVDLQAAAKDWNGLNQTYAKILDIDAACYGKNSKEYASALLSKVRYSLAQSNINEANKALDEALIFVNQDAGNCTANSPFAYSIGETALLYAQVGETARSKQLALLSMNLQPCPSWPYDFSDDSSRLSLKRLLLLWQSQGKYTEAESLLQSWIAKVKTIDPNSELLYRLKLSLAKTYARHQTYLNIEGKSADSSNYKALGDNVFAEVKKYYASTRGEQSPQYQRLINEYEAVAGVSGNKSDSNGTALTVPVPSDTDNRGGTKITAQDDDTPHKFAPSILSLKAVFDPLVDYQAPEISPFSYAVFGRTEVQMLGESITGSVSVTPKAEQPVSTADGAVGSYAKVQVYDKSKINGNITSKDVVFNQGNVVVDQTISTDEFVNKPVELPAIDLEKTGALKESFDFSKQYAELKKTGAGPRAMNLSGDAKLSLQPGMYFVNSLQLTGSAQLVVDKTASAANPVRIVLLGDQSKPNFFVGDTAQVNSEGSSSSMQIFVSKAAQLDIKDKANVCAVIYGPQATVVVSGAAVVTGSIVADFVGVQDKAQVIYDKSVKPVDLFKFVGGTLKSSK